MERLCCRGHLNREIANKIANEFANEIANALKRRPLHSPALGVGGFRADVLGAA